MKRSLALLLFALFSLSVNAGDWDVRKFYDMQKTPRQGKYGFEQVFMVYFKGIVDSHRLTDTIINQPRYCFPDNMLPSDKEIFTLVKLHLDEIKTYEPSPEFYKTPLVLIVNTVLLDTYGCNSKEPIKETEIKV
jgi:hypothetical protein